MRSNWIMLQLVVTAVAAVGLAGCQKRVALGPTADAADAAEIRKSLVAGAKETAGGGGDTAKSSEPTGWATLRGAFKVTGMPPTPGKITADKDVEVCGKHPLFDETVTIGKDNSLQNAVLFLRTKKPAVHPDYEQSAGAEVVLDNKNCRFEPHVIAMRTSQTLKIKNSDPVGHNTKLDAISSAPFNVLIPADNSTEQRLTAEEALPVKVGCSIHPWMGGWVVVRSDPYAGVSDSSGVIELKNMPAGVDLEFQLWQEKVGNLSSVTVASSAGNVKVDGKGRFKVKLEPDKTLDLTFEVAADTLK